MKKSAGGLHIQCTSGGCSKLSGKKEAANAHNTIIVHNPAYNVKPFICKQEAVVCPKPDFVLCFAFLGDPCDSAWNRLFIPLSRKARKVLKFVA